MQPYETVYFAARGRLTIHVPDGGCVTSDAEANSQEAVDRTWTAGNPEI